MKLLFLRGQVPSDRPARQIMFDKLEQNDDMWTQLAWELVNQTGGYGEVWYEKGKRRAQYRENFVERWVARYAQTPVSFDPDVVFTRGGFKIHRAKAAQFPKAFKIHYGAGQRVIPGPRQHWDLVLVDTPEQLERAQANGYNAQLFVKPAADNIFRPASPISAHPEFDVIYVANFNHNANKGHRFLLPNLRGVRLLHVGIGRRGWPAKFPNTSFTGWVRRADLPSLYARAKVAVVMTAGKDSCPRVIPEALACDTPIVVSEGTRLWHSQYITPETGRTFTKDTFVKVLSEVLGDWRSFRPREYYERELSLPVAARHILRIIGGAV
jgi:glycosyltransferase involved in cell wall biosynthesis